MRPIRRRPSSVEAAAHCLRHHARYVTADERLLTDAFLVQPLGASRRRYRPRRPTMLIEVVLTTNIIFDIIVYAHLRHTFLA